jgi:SAM-dependent methyltransferase
LSRLVRQRLAARRLRQLSSGALRQVRKSLGEYRAYLRDLDAYYRSGGAEPAGTLELRPRTEDRTELTPFDDHYLYQDLWAFKRILRSGMPAHLDVGSRLEFVAFLSAATRVTFLDIRPPRLEIENLECRKGDILHLPYADGSIPSLSCLHVAEHIGLGRYGDALDPHGTKKAMRELARVLAPGGSLYFSLPVGRPRLCFNAHRIHSPAQIVEGFAGLRLVEFSGVDDEKIFRERRPLEELEGCRYACGMFMFTK